MRWRRRARAHGRRCMTPGCGNSCSGRSSFCRACWYAVGAGVRLYIQDARRAKFFVQARDLCQEVAATLGRRRANDASRGAPAVAMCGRCRLGATDPVIGCCTDAQCPFALQAAA